MSDEAIQIARKNRSPGWVVAIFFASAAIAIAFGLWMAWHEHRLGAGSGDKSSLGMILIGGWFARDGASRLSMNRAMNDILAALIA